MAMSNLANAYLQLGLQNDDIGSLKNSAAAHQAALKVYSRERYPYDWARTQINLASPLGCLGEREAGSARLKEAAAALRSALLVCTPEIAPFLKGKAQEPLDRTVTKIVARGGPEIPRLG